MPLFDLPSFPLPFNFYVFITKALYFASSWCPDCVASKPFVSAIFKTQAKGEKLFDLVYISSDNSSDQMRSEIEPNWDAVPFENVGERSDLKKYFGVCAYKEMGELGITSEQRKGGIPTLILLEKKTCRVISGDAIPDIMGDKKVDDPLSLWKSLLSENS